jgi:hypothetical protein
LFDTFIGLPLFAGQSEPHLLDLIIIIFGQFPIEMVENSPRKDRWFREDGTFKGQEQISREERVEMKVIPEYYVRHDLRKIIMTYGEKIARNPAQARLDRERRVMFLDLLVKMLRVPQQERITAEEALLEPFLTADFSG